MDDKSDGRDKEKKRARDDPVFVDSPLSVITRSEPDPDTHVAKRARVEPEESDPDSPEVLDDLLNILDDSDGAADRDPTIHDLDSVIKSFEEEIQILVPEQQPTILDLESDSAAPPSELGYLLEASDDELGLPPSFGSSEDERKDEATELPATSSGDFGFSDSLPFDDELHNYDSFEYEICPDFSSGRDGDFVALGGLFDNDYDGGVSEILWRPETLPAV